MSVNSIGPSDVLSQLRALSRRSESGLEAPFGPASRTDFSEVLKRSLDQVNEVQQKASNLGQAFEVGDPNVSVTDLTVAVQKSSLAFQATSQVRNKLVAAYQEIMSMQV
ncbi:MAG: flagellar hook-basal body complex protein FliE [Azonexus sp.]